jgi:hypothetical protein
MQQKHHELAGTTQQLDVHQATARVQGSCQCACTLHAVGSVAAGGMLHLAGMCNRTAGAGTVQQQKNQQTLYMYMFSGPPQTSAPGFDHLHSSHCTVH